MTTNITPIKQLSSMEQESFELKVESPRDMMLISRLLAGQRIDPPIQHLSVKDTVKTHLEQVENQLDALEKRITECKLKSLQLAKAILGNSMAVAEPKVLAKECTFDQTDITESKLIMTISVYKSRQKCQTFEVEEGQSINSLADRIICPMEKMVARASVLGTDPIGLLPIPEQSKEASSQGIFVIENKSYLPDHAARITWRDLFFKIGEPYRFIHCGACEHFLIIESIRYLHQYDLCHKVPSTNELGTKEIFRLRKRHRKCRICDARTACWVTANDRLVPENPFLFCHQCYISLHYDNGRLLYSDYKVYPYYHDLT